VAGEVQFIDSFGAPRNVGTGYAHWHEGTDVMAANGTPVVAVEAGVIERAKVNTLGGNSLRLRGQSGHGYYYAHLSTYALGITEGVVVAPGQVLGYVGDTGDAKGGAPHVHFEIHRPPNDEPVNPYPILLMAWQAREDVVGLRGVRRPSPAAAPAGSAFGVVPPPGDPVVAGLPGGTPPGTVPPLLLRPPG
jgi:murein DD-endopeptidase MepM/ murein hydrolase activator NlpD